MEIDMAEGASDESVTEPISNEALVDEVEANWNRTRFDGSDEHPTIYDPRFHPAAAKKLCEFGAIDAELAEAFNVSVRTIHRWKLVHPEFAEKLKIGKDRADDRVERALYSSAIGFEYKKQQVVKVRDFDGNESVEIVDLVEQALPEFRAQSLWLRNRRGDKWAENRQLDVGFNKDKDSEAAFEKLQKMLGSDKAHAVMAEAAATADEEDEAYDDEGEEPEG